MEEGAERETDGEHRGGREMLSARQGNGLTGGEVASLERKKKKKKKGHASNETKDRQMRTLRQSTN